MKQASEGSISWIAKGIRVLTIPPVVGLAMLTYLYIAKADIFATTAQFLVAVFSICIFAVLAYPLQPLFYRIFQWECFGGREGQRFLAMIFAVVGYVVGTVIAFCSKASSKLLFIYLGYLILGSCILVCNRLLHFKLSGHAVGVAGPIALLQGLGEPGWLIGIPLLLLVLYASLRMKRHTLVQLLSGMLLPFAICLLLQILMPI